MTTPTTFRTAPIRRHASLDSDRLVSLRARSTPVWRTGDELAVIGSANLACEESFVPSERSRVASINAPNTINTSGRQSVRRSRPSSENLVSVVDTDGGAQHIPDMPADDSIVLIRSDSWLERMTRSGRGHSRNVHQDREDRMSTPPVTDPLLPATQHTNLLWQTAALDAAKLDVFTTLTRRGDDKAPKTATLNIAATQRLVIAHQQREISIEAARLYSPALTNAEWTEVCDSLRELIHTHCDAVRDLDFMQQRAAECGVHDENDPFYLKSSKQIDRLAMQQAGLIPDHVLPAGNLPIARDRDHPVLPGIPRTVAIKANKSRSLLLRFGMASAGGLFMVVPVLIMANFRGRTSSLVTTCVAMLFFAIGITFGTDLKADQVLGATAAYAAVLVVFVGTSLANIPA